MIKILMVSIGILSNGQGEIIQKIEESSLAVCQQHARQMEHTFHSDRHIVVGHFCVKETFA